MRLFSLIALAVVLPLFATQSAIAAEYRPNIILIMADDIGYECFGCYGSEQYSTPHIDRMAERGTRFTHCYSQPLCTPSRVKIMTGISNVRNYSGFSILNSDQRTIGQYFQDAGYETLVAGKWQLLGAEHYSEQFRMKGSWPEQTGFDRICLWQVDKLGSRFWQPLLYIDGENRQFGKKTRYGPDVVNEYVLDFMAEERDDPFFIYYPMILVHNPFEVTPDSESKDSKNKQRNFEDMVAYMDKMVGQVVEKTEKLGIADNTLIFFTGDNGTNTRIKSQLNGREIVGGKGKTTDAGTLVPLVALWNGVTPKGHVCQDLVDFSDFLPTCLEAAELAVPCGLDGQSFLPQLRGEQGMPRQWVHCYYCPRPERTEPKQFVRDKRWKLYDDGSFFDVANDVFEKQSLTDDALNAEAQAAKKKLEKALASMPTEGESLLKFVPNER
jgi:arylsulfatase A